MVFLTSLISFLTNTSLFFVSVVILHRCFTGKSALARLICTESVLTTLARSSALTLTRSSAELTILTWSTKARSSLALTISIETTLTRLSVTLWSAALSVSVETTLTWLSVTLWSVTLWSLTISALWSVALWSTTLAISIKTTLTRLSVALWSYLLLCIYFLFCQSVLCRLRRHHLYARCW